MESMYTEKEIDIIDLCKELLKKWKLILVFAIVFALLFSAYTLITSKQEKPETAAEVAALTAEMTNEEKTEVEDAAKIIELYRTQYAQQKEYCDNSIYQNLDPYAINTVVLSFYVDNGYKISYPVIAEQNDIVPIVQTYASALDGDDFYASFTEKLGLSMDQAYLAELITVSIGSETVGADSGIFTVKIYADSDELLSNMADFIKETLNAKTADIVALYGSHKLVLSSEVEKTVIDTGVAETQQKNLQTLTTIKTSITNVENRFSGDQLTYLKYLVHEELEEETNVAKYAVIGFFVGAIVVIAYYAVIYVLSNTIKTAEEINLVLKTNSFGNLSDNTDFVASKIDNIAALGKLKKVALVSSTEEESLTAIAKQLSVDAPILTDPLGDKADFETLAACDAMVVVVGLKSDKMKSLVALKKMCEDSNVKILGYIVK